MRVLPSVRPSTPERASPASAPERMDDPACDPVELARALDALAAANRWLGGRAAICRPIEHALVGRRPGELLLLDVGTGGGDIPRALGRRLRQRGWRPRFCLADLHAATLRLARARTTPALADDEYVRLDASRLPFATDAVDFGFAGTMLHHLETDEAAGFLAELDRVSRLGWVVSDLRRGLPIRLAVRVLGATIWRGNTLARLDGLASARRAFTAAEVRRLAVKAGLAGVAVRSGPFRWVALGGELAE